MTIADIAFPFNRDSISFPARHLDHDVIEDNIRRILLTRRGERVMRPEVGSSLHDFVFRSMGTVLQSEIEAEVRRALSVGEPRIRVLSVIVAQRTVSDHKEIVVAITYQFLGELGRALVSVP